MGLGPHHQFHSKAQDFHAPHTGATPPNSGQNVCQDKCPWVPSHLFPTRHQELDEGGPCQHSGNTYKAMWEKAMEKKAWKAPPLGRAEGGLHGLCYPQASCGPAGQRSERAGLTAFSGQPMLTGTFLRPSCGHSRFLLSLRATAVPRMASWLQCLLVTFSTAKENGAEHVLGTR